MKTKKNTAAPGALTQAELEAFWTGVGVGQRNHTFTPDQCTTYAESLSDFLCWMEGFRAAGGTYSPQSIEPLRDLNLRLKEMLRHRHSPQ